MRKTTSSNLKVGIFVLLSLAIFVFSIFIFGGENKFFTRTQKIQTSFANLKSISRKIDQGEGTMGSIINDPLLYDKINSILGEAERSRFVRATIKYLIEQRIKQDKPGSRQFHNLSG